jgi:sec-independent protein translocase protein TatB
MEILGIGAPELVFVIVIALIVLGPKDMQKAGKTIGRWLNQLVQSDGWKAFQQTSREIRNLPNNLMREANMELAETEKEVRKATDFRIPPATTSPSRVPPPPPQAENSIQPPSTPLPKTQADTKPSAGDVMESNPTKDTGQNETFASNPPETQADIKPASEDGTENRGVENSILRAPSESPPIDLADPQNTSEPNAEDDIERKADVNPADQDA